MKYYPIILPQTRTVKERILLLGVDISASVTDELIKIFISNVEAAAQRATEIVVVTFDAVVREEYRTKRPRDIFKNVKFKAGHHSHTSAMGLFEIAKTTNPSAICILTDGHENASREYRADAIKPMIEHAEKNGWAFVYLGANQDAFAVASAYGIQAGRTFAFAANAAGTKSAYATMSATTRSLRTQ
jgi:uncharacterized protein with von Willebrand factor type A (vWA) domain